MITAIKGWLTAERELWTVRYRVLFKHMSWSDAPYSVYLD